VCEVPGWGYQLSPDRVLAEITEVGLAATELGPAGFLPDDPGHAARVLRQHHLASVGGFVPVRLHVRGHDPVPEIEQVLQGYAGTGSRTLVLSADSGLAGYDTRPALDEDDWTTLLTNLDRLSALAARHDVLAVLHPHVGTMVENSCEVQRVLDGSSVALCLDTGHLLIGGTDPAELARQAPGRIAHTHLKDVNGSIAAKVRSGRITYTEGVRRACTGRSARVTWTSRPSCRCSGGAATTAGTYWSRTRSLLRSLPGKGRSPTCGRAPSTSVRC